MDACRVAAVRGLCRDNAVGGLVFLRMDLAVLREHKVGGFAQRPLDLRIRNALRRQRGVELLNGLVVGVIYRHGVGHAGGLLQRYPRDCRSDVDGYPLRYSV